MFVGYVSKDGYVNEISVLRKDGFSESSENLAAAISLFYQVDGKSTWTSDCEFNFKALGSDRCVWYAHIKSNPPKEWILVSNLTNLSSIDKNVEKKARAWFQKNKGKCQKLGEMPDCVTPAILGVTDLNKNGAPEIWYQEVFAWDLGAGMAEVDLGKGTIKTSYSICHGCD